MDNGKITTVEDVDDAVRERLGAETAELRKEIKALVKAREDDTTVAELRAEVDALRKGAEETVQRVHTYRQPFEGSKRRGFTGDEERGLDAARFLRLIAAGGNSRQEAAKIAKGWGDVRMEKSLNESVFEAGGALVPPDFMTEVIELLRATAVFRSMGVRNLDMPSGSITMPFQDTASTATYVGELQTIPASEPSYGQLELMARKLVGKVPVSNDLLHDASPNVDAMVRDDMIRVLGLREDIAFIRGDGSNSTPKGMRFLAPLSHVVSRTQAANPSTLDEITNDLHDADLRLEEANIPGISMGWLCSPRTKSGIARIRDGNGNFVYKDELSAGTLMGHPLKTTTQIPNNLVGPGGPGGGGNADKSELYLADFSSYVVGDTQGLQVKVFDGGAFDDGSGIVSGIDTDQTVLRAIARHDVGSRQRGLDTTVITNVDWGLA